MMQSIKMRQRVGQDGILHLDVPIGLTDREVEVIVIYQPVQSDTASIPSLKELYGICADDPMTIDDSGVSIGDSGHENAGRNHAMVSAA